MEKLKKVLDGQGLKVFKNIEIFLNRKEIWFIIFFHHCIKIFNFSPTSHQSWKTKILRTNKLSTGCFSIRPANLRVFIQRIFFSEKQIAKPETLWLVYNNCVNTLRIFFNLRRNHSQKQHLFCIQELSWTLWMELYLKQVSFFNELLHDISFFIRFPTIPNLAMLYQTLL